MRITAVDMSTKRPLANSSIQLQIRGQNSGFLSVKTDQNGHFVLDDSYLGHQLTFTLGAGASDKSQGQGQWITATDGGVLSVPAKQKATSGAGTTK